MDCNECYRLERFVLESLVFADKAGTALRCYLITHEWSASVSDVDEYHALRAEQQSRRMNDIKPTWLLLITRKLTSSASASVRGLLHRHPQLDPIVRRMNQVLLGP